jgi:hypothetical protein
MILSKLMVIEYLVGISGATLVVYRVDEYFQYEILFWDGSIYQPQEIYDTLKVALNVGIDSIKTTIGY